MNEIRILVVDDHALVRDGIISMLNKVEEFKIVGEASNSSDAITKNELLDPDIILMDIMLGEVNGIETTRIIMENDSDVKVVFLSMDISEKFISEAVNIGAAGYIPKDIKKDLLIDGIRKVQLGKKFFSDQISEIIFQKLYVDSNQPTNKKGDKPLSDREIEVLTLIANGVANKNIAEQLFISVRTVDAHRNNILQKLKLGSTADLVKYAIKNSYVTLD